MKIPLLSFLILISPLGVLSQTSSGDSLLANERAIDRPVNVHARQLRVTGAYTLSLIARRFDSSKKKISLEDDGLRRNVRHRFLMDIKYGINDYIQLNTAIGYSSNLVREQTRYLLPDAAPQVSHDVSHQYQGIEDLYIGIDLRAPLKTRKIDIALTLGATVPVAPFEPEEPEHSIQASEENGTPVSKFKYHYHYPMGTGVVVARVGGIVKYRSALWAVSARVDYQHGLKAGSTHHWRHQLNGDVFEYREQPVSFRLPDSNTYFVEGEYQPAPWLDIFLTASGHTTFHGWTSDQENVKVATSYQTTWQLAPGFEVIITPRFWVRERVVIAVAGKDYEAPLSFQTTLMYNFFW